jgi:protein-S-isoprenylcysteine O-methyltransferase Ste14
MTPIISYLLIASFFVLEARLRQGQEAKSREATETDRRSTQWVGGEFGLSLVPIVVAPILNALHVGQISWHSRLLGWGGVTIMTIGLALRVWAAGVLGRFYTRTLRTVEQQRIVRCGPYRMVRHPGYLGVMLMWVGAGLAVLNWITLAVIVVATVSAYIHSVQAEEAMLAQAFEEEFIAYRAKTWKLIPFIY